MINLSNIQRVVLLIGIFFIVLSFLFPCWNVINNQHRISNRDYHFIFTPPVTEDVWRGILFIDMSRLWTQVIIIIIVTIGMMVVLPPKKIDSQ